MIRSTLFAGLLVFLLISTAFSQTDQTIVIDPWPDKFFGQTTDKFIYQAQSHSKDGTGNAQIFWWDSHGRFRIGTENPDAPVIGYRYLTENFDTHVPALPKHLDKLSVAGGLKLGEVEGGQLGLVLGAGYVSDNPFADANGVFGESHLTWNHKIDDSNSFALTLDYDGGGSFLSDVPLPGFEYDHYCDEISWGFGFPRTWAEWKPTHRLTFTALYTVPFSADLYADYKIGKGVSVFGNFANFFESFQLSGVPTTTRLFQQMRRIEFGVRYINDNLIKGFGIDVALAGGYAFDQHFWRGWDIRDMDRTAALSDVPYVALIVRGTF